MATKLLLVPTLVCVLLSQPARASTVGINLRAAPSPAEDLVQGGAHVDRDEVIALSKSGVDVSRLDPAENDVWGDRESKIAPVYPADGAEIDFVAAARARKGIFMAQVSDHGKRYRLMARVQGHAALATQALLQRLGYKIPSSRLYSSLTIRFASVFVRDELVDSLADQTMSARTRWVRAAPKDAPVLTLQDMILEPADTSVVPYHWGVVTDQHVQGRRAVRALLAPLAWMDIPESVRRYDSQLGKVVGDYLVIDHPSAEAFAEGDVEDLRWIARRMSRLSRQDIREILVGAGFPEPVVALLVERAISRRNQLNQILGLAIPALDCDVSKPVAIEQQYPGHAELFGYTLKPSPFRMSEVARYGVIEAISEGLAKATDYLNGKLELLSIEDAQRDHAQETFVSLLTYLFQPRARDHAKNPGADKPFSIPLQAWTGPVANGSVGASRNVVVGLRYGGLGRAGGTNVQLVDTFTVGVQLGYFGAVDGLYPRGGAIVPSMLGGVGWQRTYAHMRPLEDMQTALKTSWKQLWVKGYLGHLAESLDPQVDSLQKLLDQLKPGETLMVIDALTGALSTQASLPLLPLLSVSVLGIGPRSVVSFGTQAGVIRRTTILRTETGLQVTLQDARSEAMQGSYSLQAWVELLCLGAGAKHTEAHTEAMTIEPSEVQGEKRLELQRALRQLLKSNDGQALSADFPSLSLDHELGSSSAELQLLPWSWSKFKQSHEVTVRDNQNPEDVSTLYSYQIQHRNAVNPLGLLANFLNAVIPGTGSLLAKSDISGNLFGKSRTLSVTSETELTADNPEDPGVVIDEHWLGGKLGREDLSKLLDRIEAQAKPLSPLRPILSRDTLVGMDAVRFYDVGFTLLLTSDGVKAVDERLFAGDPKQTLQALIDLEGSGSYAKWCESVSRMRTSTSLKSPYSVSFRDGRDDYFFPCVKPWMKPLVMERVDHVDRPRLSDETPKMRAKRIAKLMSAIVSNVPVANLLATIPREQLYYQAQITGFVKKDDRGVINLVSDALGNASPRAASVFARFAERYRLSIQELQASYLGEGK